MLYLQRRRTKTGRLDPALVRELPEGLADLYRRGGDDGWSFGARAAQDLGWDLDVFHFVEGRKTGVELGDEKSRVN